MGTKQGKKVDNRECGWASGARSPATTPDAPGPLRAGGISGGTGFRLTDAVPPCIPVLAPRLSTFSSLCSLFLCGYPASCLPTCVNLAGAKSQNIPFSFPMRPCGPSRVRCPPPHSRRSTVFLLSTFCAPVLRRTYPSPGRHCGRRSRTSCSSRSGPAPRGPCWAHNPGRTRGPARRS